MYVSTSVKGGTQLVELHLCVKCCRMITLNDERYYKKYVKNWQAFAYAHKVCPPMKTEGPPMLEQ